MKHREADFGTLFRHWLHANPLKISCAFELKQTTTDSISFACLEAHQAQYGEAIMEAPKGVLTRVQGTNGEPDYFYSFRVPVYIVIKYPKAFFIIRLKAFLKERDESDRKSLTVERAREIAMISVDL